jgi:hypothetical protein
VVSNPGLATFIFNPMIFKYSPELNKDYEQRIICSWAMPSEHVMNNARLFCLMLTVVLSPVSQANDSEAERIAKQTELDAACEAAREEKLSAVRAQLIEECDAKKEWPREDRAACERYYADYGIATPWQPGLFYDLPECVKAHDYRRSDR